MIENEKIDCVDALVFGLNRTAEWRKKTAIRYPSDPRNARAAECLANLAAKATEEIGAQVAGMQASTSETVNAIREIRTTIGGVSEIATDIASAVETQGVMTREIATNVGQAAAGTAEVAANIADVSQGSVQTGSASTQVLQSARALSTDSTQLKSAVEKFLVTVRAA